MKLLGRQGMVLVGRVAMALVAATSFVADARSQTKMNGGTVAVQSGDCRVLLNGMDVGCPNGAVHSVLQNGRHLVNFAGGDVATVGFAGAKLDATSGTSSVLWLDGAYINQKRFPADGQCSFERQPTGAIALKCSAVLRDGRKLTASLAASDQRDSFLGVTSLSKQILDCERLIEMHGMLSRAQFQCGFSRYSNRMLDDAKKCAGVVGEEAAKQQLSSGMELFDYNEGRQGHDAMCKSVLENFPGLVRK